MADIVDRLRDLAAIDNCQASLEAADEIERLRAALREIADYNTEIAYERDGEMDWDIWRNMKQYARTALEGRT